MVTGRKLPITLGLVVLIGLAFGASCNGFFVDPTLTGIAVSPTAPQVEAGKTITLQAFGTYDDGTRKQVKSGVSWSSAPTDVATIDSNTGILTGKKPGTSVITASAQALQGTATATVFIANISNLRVQPTSASVPTTGGQADFNAIATANGIDVDVTTGATWTVSPTPTAGAINCTDDGLNPPETCTVNANTTPATYTITVTYPGTNIKPTATLIVTP
jgi:uncharacterized protein YjdB